MSSVEFRPDVEYDFPASQADWDDYQQYLDEAADEQAYFEGLDEERNRFEESMAEFEENFADWQSDLDSHSENLREIAREVNVLKPLGSS